MGKGDFVEKSGEAIENPSSKTVVLRRVIRKCLAVHEC